MPVHRTCFLFAAYLAQYPHGAPPEAGTTGAAMAGRARKGAEMGRGGLTPASPQRALGASVPEL